MSHKVEPQVFCIGESHKNKEELLNYLAAIGSPDWETDALDDVSEIIEIDGRACYLSFGTELNENINQVRVGNEPYIRNIIKVAHGSVLEHAFVNFQIVDVSRVFTHELVRHRAGTAISQESLRYVRANDLGYWIPPCFEDIPEMESLFKSHWRQCEATYERVLSLSAEKELNIKGQNTKLPQLELIEAFNKMPFDIKKKYTSAARRFLPIGMATKIGWSCNIRTLRHVLEMRTDPSAEEEIRYVFGNIGLIAKERWPYLFADYRVEYVDGLPHFKTEYRKV